MEIQTDQGLLVVNLENCISNAAVHQMVKGDCNVYTVAVATGNDGPTMVQIPVSLQCSNNVQQNFNPVGQLHHLTNNVLQQYRHEEYNQVPLTEQLQCLTERSEPSQPPQEPPSSSKQAQSIVENKTGTNSKRVLTSACKIDYGDIHNFISSGLIPKGVSNEYKRILKKRSQHYCVIDKTLYYGRNPPRKVVIGKEAQQEVLKDHHVKKDTGVHLGVRKMFASIANTYFWQEMYMDVATYVRDCKGCSEVLALGIKSMKDSSSRCDKNGPIDGDSSLSVEKNIIWQKVEAHMYGPYSRTVRQNQFILAVMDPVSKWIITLPVPNNNLTNRMTNFIFEKFCVFGFAKCSVVGISSENFVTLKNKYQDHCKQIHQDMPEIELMDMQLSKCSWAEQLIDSMTSANPADWDRENEKYLYKFRTTALDGGPSPFSMMFQRSPKSRTEENKENSNKNQESPITDISSKRRKLQCSILQCRHCDQDFTSKISFRIHQRKHTEEARFRGRLEGQELLTMVDDEDDMEEPVVKKKVTKKKQKLRQTGNFSRANQLLAKVNRSESRSNQQLSIPNDINRAQLKANTLAAVRHMLACTKEERRKRGRYHKYPTELQEEMASYAMEHGNHETVRVFSQRLGCVVSESTIRNIVKLYRSYTPEIKEEIGRFAAAFGIDAAANHFTNRLGREVRQGLVRKFKKLYLRRYPDSSNRSQVPNSVKKNVCNTLISKKKSSYKYTEELKEEIGSHACLNSINDTIRHYSQKLQISLKNNTVRRFRKLYLDKHQQVEMGSQASMLQQQLQQNLTSLRNSLDAGEPSTSLPMDAINPSLTILTNQQNQQTPNYNQPYQTAVNHNTSLTFLNQCSSNNTPTNITLAYHQNQAHSTPVLVNQTPNDLAFNQTLNPMHAYQQQTQQEYLPYDNSEPTLQTTSVPLPQQSCISQQNPVHMIPSSSSFSQVSTVTVLAPSIQSQPSYSSSLMMGHQASSTLNQRSVLPFGHQTLGSLEILDKQQEQMHTQLIERSVSQPNSQQNCTQNISTTFVQNLPGNTQFSFGNTIPVLIADRDGTYTLTTALNAEEPITLEENGSQPIVIKLKHQSSDNMSDQGISNIGFQGDLKCLQTPSEAKTMLAAAATASNTDNDKQKQQGMTYVQVQLNCNSMEECVDDPDYVDGDDICIENLEQRKTVDVAHSIENLEEPPSSKSEQKSTSKRKSTKKKKESLGKRGQYTTYSPELRAEMGKYAAEHGSQRTCQYFRAQLGHDIPESTVRGLRDKYLLKREQKTDEVTSLGYSPRGRPVRLGKYDEVVQECIRELVKSGEKISSFLAIATAKQVLMQYEPGLLEANGGPIKLNITWAKSFLKRIGVHNNS